ncbi:MAG: alanine racemase [Prolixibacteraceae bacterium]|nr:alanine racemase [Prolixibacteraceae bacterium]
MAEITRPTLVVNKKICLRNIERMAQKADSLHLRFRPHFKTHQSAKIGEWFKLSGVNAITVSSVQMAEYFAQNGWDDITLAFPLNILEIENINRLAASVRLNVLVENRDAAKAISEKVTSPLGVYLKIDTGYHRTGILPEKTGLMDAIIKTILTNRKITFKGFLSHTGHTYQARSTNEIFSRHYDALLKLRTLKQKYRSAFPQVKISIGDTPSCTLCTNFTGIDEIRPGNFVFYDLMQQNLGVCSFEDIAVRLVCPVIATHPSRNEVVIYGGAVHLSKESILNTDGKQMFGRIVIQKNGEKKLLDTKNYVAKLSQEHSILKVAQNQLKNFKVGDLVEIIPVHSCLTANLMGCFQTTDGKFIEMMPKY